MRFFFPSSWARGQMRPTAMSILKPNGSLSGKCLITLLLSAIQFWLLAPHLSCAAELHDPADRGEPGDVMIQEYLRQEAEKIESDFLVGIKSAEDWNQARPRFRQEDFDMLDRRRTRL